VNLVLGYEGGKHFYKHGVSPEECTELSLETTHDSLVQIVYRVNVTPEMMTKIAAALSDWSDEMKQQNELRAKCDCGSTYTQDIREHGSDCNYRTFVENRKAER
jgi:hypothetical protein